MAYQVLARKWRPQKFSEVVGQEHISRTLKNAIVQNRIGHAYLFVGSRGIGKTTTARIFAKALNCPNNKDGEPCCECESCREVMNGSSMDVIEIDGASHNKVEDVRDIRDNVQYAPTRGRYKIYIIDEVHMLTTQAWNALLKTLEEPPPHVKFLFATTEPHKVLPTIISRCQRFDLKRLSVPLIMSRLRQIADGEKINIEDAALAAIARAADGGMRDAQSIFDQIIAFCGGTDANELIREKDVIDVFGLASGMELREIASTIFTNDLNGALKILQKLADAGRDLERLYADLIEYVRKIMVAGLCPSANDILEVSDTELDDLTNIGKALDPQMVQRALQQLIAQEWAFRSALNKRIYFEATLAKVMLEVHSVQLDDIFTQLNQISGTIPKTPIPPRPQIVIPPPVIQQTAAPQQNPKSPVSTTASEQATAPKAITAAENSTTTAVTEAARTTETTAAAKPVEAPKTSRKAEAPEAAKDVEAPEAVKPVEAPETEKKAEEPEAEKKAEASEVVKPVEVPKTAKKAEVPETAKAVEAPEATKTTETLEAIKTVETTEMPNETETTEEISGPSLNDLLMQASSSSIDIEDEADPALATTSNSIMDSFTPEAVYGRLLDKLADQSEDLRAYDLLAQMQPRGLGQYGLTLACDKNQLSSDDVEYLGNSKTQAFINKAFRSLNLSGKVKINYANDSQEDGERIKYRPASILEIQRMLQETPFIQTANSILSTKLTEGRIQER